MTAPIPLNLAFEDALTESLTVKILRTIPTQYATRTIYNRGGNGYLRQVINGFNNAAKGTPFLVGTDLDEYDCPPALINDWLIQAKHHNLWFALRFVKRRPGSSLIAISSQVSLALM